MVVNVRARITSRRKATFLWFDSIRVIGLWGDQILMGRPGNPAPEPRSTIRGTVAADCGPEEEAGDAPGSGSRWRAAKSDSPKWRVTICSGSRIAVRFTRLFQRSNRSI